MTGHVISLGDLVIDLIAPVTLPVMPFQHQESRALHVEPGGSGNFMITGARLGMKVSAVGTIGDDLFGAFLLQVFQAEGIGTGGIVVTPGATSTVVLDLIDHATQNHVFIGNTGDGELATLTPAMEAALKSAGALFFQGYTLVEKRMRGLAFPYLRLARAAGIPIFFDIGPTVVHLAADRLQEALTLSDVLMLTADEIPLAAEGQRGEQAYGYLLGLGPKLLVVKQGGEGCTLVSAGEQPGQLYQSQVPGFAVNVVDTVGAGDCFDAAFIYGWLHAFDQRTCATLANATGAACVQKMGAGRNAPTCAEIKAILDRGGIHIPLAW